MIPIRDENPTRRVPVVTIALIAINAAVFLYQFIQLPDAQREFVYTFGAIPLLLTRDFHLLPQFPTHWPSLISSMFLHGGFLHLGGNMLYLWIFGNNIEDHLGRVRFVFFYVLCGIVAALTHTLSDITSAVPMIGASGAISGLLGAYLLLYPRANVVVLIWFFFFLRFIRIPAFIVLGLWFVMQLPGTLTGASSGIAFFAHIGGFIFGLATIKLMGRHQPRRSLFA
jgi:membrane associated rhomboid family serine protease